MHIITLSSLWSPMTIFGAANFAVYCSKYDLKSWIAMFSWCSAPQYVIHWVNDLDSIITHGYHNTMTWYIRLANIYIKKSCGSKVCSFTGLFLQNSLKWCFPVVVQQNTSYMGWITLIPRFYLHIITMSWLRSLVTIYFKSRGCKVGSIWVEIWLKSWKMWFSWCIATK